jgi:uncharacterized protein YoxC
MQIEDIKENLDFPIIEVEEQAINEEKQIEAEKPEIIEMQQIEDKTIIAGHTLAKQIFDFKNLLTQKESELALSIQAQTEQAKQIEALTNETSGLKTQLESIGTELKNKDESIKGYEIAVADLNAKVEKQEKMLNLKEYKELAEGHEKPIQVIHGETKTILETYRSLQGNERFDFYKKHEAEIKKALN